MTLNPQGLTLFFHAEDNKITSKYVIGGFFFLFGKKQQSFKVKIKI